MTIDQLEMLEAIVLEGSMQKAALRIHKSQPSLSMGIKKIEDLYGIRLFSRETYRPSLTQEGEIFYQNALKVLSSHRALEKIARELSGTVEPRIHIVIDPIVSLSRVEHCLKEALSALDTTQIVINEGVLDYPIEALLNKEVQFAIGHCPPNRFQDVEKKKVGIVELVPAIQKGLDFRKLPNIVVTEDSDLQDLKRSPHSTWYVCSHSRKEELINAGLGWGRIPKLKVKESNGRLSHVRSLSHQKFNLEIYLMIHKEAPLGFVGSKMWSVFPNVT